MPKGLTFEEITDDALRTYRFVGGDQLFDHTWKPADMKPGWSLIYDEVSALYLGLIWRLTAGLMVYAVPRFDRVAGMYAAGEPYALVNWEYDVENQGGDDLGALRGFVPARSVVRSFPAPGPWARENEMRAGLFEVPVFSMLQRIFERLLSDETAELNVYAVASQESSDRLAAALQRDEPPDLQECLDPGELFVYLSVGVDFPGTDVIVIHSRTNVAEQIQALATEYRESAASYQRDIPALANREQWEARVERMVNLGADRDLSRWAGLR